MARTSQTKKPSQGKDAEFGLREDSENESSSDQDVSPPTKKQKKAKEQEEEEEPKITRKRRRKDGMSAAQRHKENRQTLLVPLEPFKRVVREIVGQHGNFRISAEAHRRLQEVAENLIFDQFKKAERVRALRGGVTRGEDMELVYEGTNNVTLQLSDWLSVAAVEQYVPEVASHAKKVSFPKYKKKAKKPV